MADILADSILPSGGDGVTLSGSQTLLFGSAIGSSVGIGFAGTSPVDTSSSLTTVLSLTGRRVTSYILINSLGTSTASLRVQLLIDGAIVVDKTESSGLNSILIIGSSLCPITLKSNSSIEVKVQKAGAVSVSANYGSLVVL